jgi:hypothetical protein
MNPRREKIRSLVEEVLQEATPGFFAGFAAGLRAPGRVEIPQPPSAITLGRQETALNKLARNTTASPFLRAAAQQELRDTQREIAGLPGVKRKLRRAKVGSVLGGVAGTLLKLPYKLVAPIAQSSLTNLRTMSTSADAGTLQGKGYKV